MQNFKKFLRKFLPRLGAVAIALALGLGCYAVSVLFLYKPSSDNRVPFSTSPTDPGKQNPIASDRPSETHYNFLVLGHDRAASLTDVIMLISYDTKAQSVTIMQIPRDTYVEIGDHFYHKINGVYNYFVTEAQNNGSKNPDLDGLWGFASFLEENLCVKIHNCAIMSLDGFSGIVNTIGGVDMYVPQDMYYPDPEQNLYIDLKQGYQHLDGDKAEQFVRYRYGYVDGDIGRGNAQKLFMAAFINKLKTSVKDPSVLPGLASNLMACVDTDLKVEDIVYFGTKFLGFGNEHSVDMNNVKMFTMPGGAPPLYNGASYYVMNRAAVADVIDEYFNVYSFSVADSFDKDECFVGGGEYEVLHQIYSADKESYAIDYYNAGEITDQNG